MLQLIFLCLLRAIVGPGVECVRIDTGRARHFRIWCKSVDAGHSGPGTAKLISMDISDITQSLNVSTSNWYSYSSLGMPSDDQGLRQNIVQELMRQEFDQSKLIIWEEKLKQCSPTWSYISQVLPSVVLWIVDIHALKTIKGGHGTHLWDLAKQCWQTRVKRHIAKRAKAGHATSQCSSLADVESEDDDKEDAPPQVVPTMSMSESFDCEWFGHCAAQ